MAEIVNPKYDEVRTRVVSVLNEYADSLTDIDIDELADALTDDLMDFVEGDE